MATTLTTNKQFSKQGTGDNPGAWGPIVNTNFDLLDTNLGGTYAQGLTNVDVSISLANAENLRIQLTGVLLANVAVKLPSGMGGFWIIDNQTTGSFTVTVKTTAGGSTGITATQGYTTFVYSNGTDVKLADSAPPSTVSASNVTATAPSNLTGSDVQAIINSIGAKVPQVGWLVQAAVPLAPTGTLFCDGSAVSRTTYASLFAYLVTAPAFASVPATIASASATFTVTIASPAVFTSAAHGLTTGQPVQLSTTGTLPTGLTAATTYFVETIDTNTFYLAATSGGTRITTTGTQSGTHTWRRAAIVTSAGHGFVGNERLRFSTTGALPSGMSTSADYFVLVIDTNTFYLSTARKTTTYLYVTSAGSGTQSYQRSYWGLGNGTTTFNLPDLRDTIVRGYDGTGARAFGTWQSSQNLAHTHTFTGDALPAHSHQWSSNNRNYDSGGLSALNNPQVGNTGSDGSTTTSVSAGTPTGTIASSGGSEARPANETVCWCIVY